ncbi:TetR/AcrR family transcriptional regulator [Parafrankia discariae]|uniref:TetR/AcrR family transcriptional regulator n=1 Tax=Parafrankia discariae TaxID=365528 RepID=UPI00036E6A7F|nr:TetR/AcrR family transcriptional regulator [Parafrankia discariae]
MTRPPSARRGRKPNAEVSDPRPTRQRLLDAANELFYAEGVQSVGIDRIIERAGVAKGSLYNTFGSKEALVRAYLESRHEGTTRRLSAVIDAVDDPREKLLAVFDAQGELFEEPDFHGCAFVSASAEATPGGFIEKATEDYRSWVRTMFTDLAAATGVRDPEALGRQLQLVYDGAGLAADIDRDPTVALSARTAAAALLAAALAESDTSHASGRR